MKAIIITGTEEVQKEKEKNGTSNHDAHRTKAFSRRKA
jgi:hypothetical protein